MSFFGNLFGTASAVNNIVDKENGLLVRAGTAIGNFHYSDQEKANDDKAVKEWGIRFLDSLQPFKIVQRILALSTMFVFVFIVVNIVVAIWVKALHPEIDAVTDLLTFAFSDFVFWPILSIFALYTGGGTINSLRGGK